MRCEQSNQTQTAHIKGACTNMRICAEGPTPSRPELCICIRRLPVLHVQERRPN